MKVILITGGEERISSAFKTRVIVSTTMLKNWYMRDELLKQIQFSIK